VEKALPAGCGFDVGGELRASDIMVELPQAGQAAHRGKIDLRRAFDSMGSVKSPLEQVSLIHPWNDAFFAMLFPILPLIATEFSLS